VSADNEGQSQELNMTETDLIPIAKIDIIPIKSNLHRRDCMCLLTTEFYFIMLHNNNNVYQNVKCGKLLRGSETLFVWIYRSVYGALLHTHTHTPQQKTSHAQLPRYLAQYLQQVYGSGLTATADTNYARAWFEGVRGTRGAGRSRRTYGREGGVGMGGWSNPFSPWNNNYHRNLAIYVYASARAIRPVLVLYLIYFVLHIYIYGHQLLHSHIQTPMHNIYYNNII